MTRLTRAGFVRRFTPGTIIYHRRPEKIGVVFTLGELGARVLASLVGRSCATAKARWPNTHTLAHDLLLTEVVAELELELQPAGITNGQDLVCHAKRGNGLVPDFVFEMPRAGCRVAIELELTAKSESRYQNIFAEYRTDPRFEKVIYVVPNATVRAKCMRILGAEADEGNGVITYGRFEFRLLDELLPEEPLAEGKVAMPNLQNGDRNLTQGAHEKGSAA